MGDRKPKVGKGKGKSSASSRGAKPASRKAGRKAAGNRKLAREATVHTRWWVPLQIAKWGAIAALVLSAIGAAGIAGLFWHFGSDPSLPKIDSLRDYRPKVVTRIVTTDGRVIGELYEERQRRTFVPIEEIPEVVVHAFTYAEDADFFEHGGLDYWGMVRAVVVNLRSGKKKQGASTITQQVVKTFLLSPERTFRRKFQEIILARRLEQALTKEEILSLYLNQIYFGHGRYGVQEAALFYFGKGIREVSAGEAALLAGLPKAPENYSPKKPENVERAKQRQHYVLEQMAHHGAITEAEARKWINRPIKVVADPFPDLNTAPEWVDLVRRDLVARYGEAELPYLGMTVVVSLDLDAQRMATEQLRSGLRELDARQKHGRPIRHLKADKIPLHVAKLARRLPKRGPKVGEVYESVVLEVHGAGGSSPGELVVDLGDWKASVLLTGPLDARYNPDKQAAADRFAVGDVVRVAPAGDAEHKPRYSGHVAEFETGPEGAVVIIDPATRQVLAFVGGYDSAVAGFDRATMAKRQPGSSFKPFVYAAAIDSGEFTPATLVIDAPVVEDDNGGQWKPQNYKKGQYEGRVRLRHALAKSINTSATRVINVVGPGRVATLAAAMGIHSELPHTPSLALGAGEVTPLEITNAYATFAAGGVAVEPQFVLRYGDEVVAGAEPVQALRPEVAYVATEMMRSVVEEGTATGARKLNMTIAGKTGTTNGSRDAWFIGMSPEIVVGVWIGNDNFEPLGRKESGGRAALPVFVGVVQGLGKRLSRTRTFERPPGVVSARIDKVSGLLAAPGAPDETTFMEVFVEGTEPTEEAASADQVTVDDFLLDQYGDGQDGADAAPGASLP